MSKTHWKKLTNPNYLGAYALEPGCDLVATIKEVKLESVTGPEGKTGDCTVAYFVEPNIKPLILNKTNCKTIAKLYKSDYVEDWSGKQIQIYVDKRVRFGRDLVEGLRIRPIIPKQIKADSTGKFICEECGREITAYGKMTAAQVAQYAYQKYGRELCTDCGKKATEIGKAADVLAEDKPDTNLNNAEDDLNENNENQD